MHTNLLMQICQKAVEMEIVSNICMTQTNQPPEGSYIPHSNFVCRGINIYKTSKQKQFTRGSDISAEAGNEHNNHAFTESHAKNQRASFIKIAFSPIKI